MGILFTTHMGFLFTITLGILFTIVLGIQFTISILLTLIVSISLALRNFNIQRRLNYLQSVLQTTQYRIRLKEIIFAINFLAAIERLFSDPDLTEDKLNRSSLKETNYHDIMRVWIYIDSRIWALKNRKRKKKINWMIMKYFF